MTPKVNSRVDYFLNKFGKYDKVQKHDAVPLAILTMKILEKQLELNSNGFKTSQKEDYMTVKGAART